MTPRDMIVGILLGVAVIGGMAYLRVHPETIRQQVAEAVSKQSLPTIEVSKSLTDNGITLDGWVRDETRRLGGTAIVGRVTTTKLPLRANQLQYELFDAAGLKLYTWWVHHPALRAGESGSAGVIGENFDKVARVVILP